MTRIDDVATFQDTSQMPIATALFVATCLGTPAIALTGLKLGMFAAVGGGIMGFATGKMFAEHELVEIPESREETFFCFS